MILGWISAVGGGAVPALHHLSQHSHDSNGAGEGYAIGFGLLLLWGVGWVIWKMIENTMDWWYERKEDAIHRVNIAARMASDEAYHAKHGRYPSCPTSTSATSPPPETFHN